ncbi:hypothetical protein GXW82_30845 [Streptacidiphilus sp. 4-A2]|nr:hypothetical protein [Streptacidiphilus sp. 4-A2]
MAVAIAPFLLVGTFFVTFASPADAVQLAAASVPVQSGAAQMTSSFVHEVAGGGHSSWETDKVAPGAVPRTYRFTVPAPASECAWIHQKYPNIKIGKTCENVETLTVGAAHVVKESPGVHASAVRPATTYYATGSSSACSAISCDIWGNFVTTGFYYTGGEVWEDFLDCNDSRGVGYNVSVTWCGNWHNYATSQTGSYMNDGDDIEVAMVAKGIPVSFGHWQRINCNVDGEVWVTGA